MSTDKPFVIDCFLDPDPIDEDNPNASEVFDTFAEMEARFALLVSGNRFQCLIQYEDSPDEWVEVHRWSSRNESSLA